MEARRPAMRFEGPLALPGCVQRSAKQSIMPTGGTGPGLMMRYPVAPSRRCSRSRMTPFLRRPVRKARMLCVCHPVAAAMSPSKAPRGRDKSLPTIAALVGLFALDWMGASISSVMMASVLLLRECEACTRPRPARRAATSKIHPGGRLHYRSVRAPSPIKYAKSWRMPASTLSQPGTGTRSALAPCCAQATRSARWRAQQQPSRDCHRIRCSPFCGQLSSFSSVVATPESRRTNHSGATIFLMRRLTSHSPPCPSYHANHRRIRSARKLGRLRP